ncbi:hypothetical protein HF888_14840 [Bermanella marisrubri]|uniref:Uncharacterized protein n=1 Tax=Bermanella marisrubri TaxID=207949 RepID=Q1N231_9GAMM|nr:hypothetical protein [Bermanella marisrubri]EAT12333.1 hypothetical protein RED65_15878 [Bermanella marisrubri]QIZ85418.1 hypothetical protein HF888_14840 [Bermanella marisrubri]
MNDDQLDRSLRSIGKACFVKYFAEFSDLAISSEDLIDMLMQQEGYTESGCKTRISNSRRIISSGRQDEALAMIIASERVEAEIVDKARELRRNK